MLSTTKTLLALAVFVSSVLVTDAFGQEQITLDRVNHIPQTDLDSLADLGAAMTIEDYTYLMLPQDLLGDTVRFTAVVATDPYSSGRATVNNDRVDRIHVFVVDTTANSAADSDEVSYWGELVDGRYEDNGTLELAVGDVIDVTGLVNAFNQTTQIEPYSYQIVGTMAELGISESILDPVVIESADLTNEVEGGFQTNVREWPRLGKRYVRLENARVENRIIEDTGQPHMIISTNDGPTVEFSNTSIVFRNDKARTYPPEFNHRGETWRPPPPGSIVNYMGYVKASGDARLSTSVPTFAQVNVEPYEISDIEILETPPQVSDPVGPADVPGEDAVTIAVEVIVDPAREITGVNLKYAIGPSEEVADSVAMANTVDNTWEGEIPGQADGTFVRYWTVATDNTGSTGESGMFEYRVLADGINEIAHIQETFSGGTGGSPFAGSSPSMDIWAVVQTRPDVSGMLGVQDKDDLAGWSGIHIQLTNEITAMGLAPGDSLHITGGTIVEDNGMPGFDSQNNSTQIADAVVEKGGSIGKVAAGLGYKDVTTAEMADDAFAEAHESMLVNFSDVVITDNDPGFGDWKFATEGDTTDQYADDGSPGFEGTGPELFEIGMKFTFNRGFWTDAFGTYRLLPEDNDDVGEEVATAVEPVGLGVPERFALDQNYPNPFNPSTTITFDVGDASHVSLQVYDVTGRLVESLVNGQLGAGSYKVTFDAGSLSSGVYLYRLQAGANVMTKRMLLLK